MIRGNRVKISQKYQARLTNYLEWQDVTTPLSSFAMSTNAIALPSVYHIEGITAAEWLFTFETHGNNLGGCKEYPLLVQYWAGKIGRDYWHKEIGWWDKNGVYQPEEFLRFMNPLCFIELFGRAPIDEFVRYYYDNQYSLLDFRMDMKLKTYIRKYMIYFDRDPRMSWIKVLYHIFRLRYVEPTVWKLKRRLWAISRLKSQMNSTSLERDKILKTPRPGVKVS